MCPWRLAAPAPQKGWYLVSRLRASNRTFVVFGIGNNELLCSIKHTNALGHCVNCDACLLVFATLTLNNGCTCQGRCKCRCQYHSHRNKVPATLATKATALFGPTNNRMTELAKNETAPTIKTRRAPRKGALNVGSNNSGGCIEMPAKKIGFKVDRIAACQTSPRLKLQWLN